MIKYQYLLAGLIITFCACGDAQNINGSQYEIITDERKFAKKIQNAVRCESTDSISKLADFPLLVNGEKISSPEVLQKTDKRLIFTDSFKKAVLKTDLNRIYCNSDGYMLGNGEIWFCEIIDPDSDSSKGLRIIALNIK